MNFRRRGVPAVAEPGGGVVVLFAGVLWMPLNALPELGTAGMSSGALVSQSRTLVRRSPRTGVRGYENLTGRR
jgi:hypothetical protein